MPLPNSTFTVSESQLRRESVSLEEFPTITVARTHEEMMPTDDPNGTDGETSSTGEVTDASDTRTEDESASTESSLETNSTCTSDASPTSESSGTQWSTVDTATTNEEGPTTEQSLSDDTGTASDTSVTTESNGTEWSTVDTSETSAESATTTTESSSSSEHGSSDEGITTTYVSSAVTTTNATEATHDTPAESSTAIITSPTESEESKLSTTIFTSTPTTAITSAEPTGSGATNEPCTTSTVQTTASTTAATAFTTTTKKATQNPTTTALTSVTSTAPTKAPHDPTVCHLLQAANATETIRPINITLYADDFGDSEDDINKEVSHTGATSLKICSGGHFPTPEGLRSPLPPNWTVALNFSAANGLELPAATAAMRWVNRTCLSVAITASPALVVSFLGGGGAKANVLAGDAANYGFCAPSSSDAATYPPVALSARRAMAAANGDDDEASAAEELRRRFAGSTLAAVAVRPASERPGAAPPPIPPGRAYNGSAFVGIGFAVFDAQAVAVMSQSRCAAGAQQRRFRRTALANPLTLWADEDAEGGAAGAIAGFFAVLGGAALLFAVAGAVRAAVTGSTTAAPLSLAALANVRAGAWWVLVMAVYPGAAFVSVRLLSAAAAGGDGDGRAHPHSGGYRNSDGGNAAAGAVGAVLLLGGAALVPVAARLFVSAAWYPLRADATAAAIRRARLDLSGGAGDVTKAQFVNGSRRHVTKIKGAVDEEEKKEEKSGCPSMRSLVGKLAQYLLAPTGLHRTCAAGECLAPLATWRHPAPWAWALLPLASALVNALLLGPPSRGTAGYASCLGLFGAAAALHALLAALVAIARPYPTRVQNGLAAAPLLLTAAALATSAGAVAAVGEASFGAESDGEAGVDWAAADGHVLALEGLLIAQLCLALLRVLAEGLLLLLGGDYRRAVAACASPEHSWRRIGAWDAAARRIASGEDAYEDSGSAQQPWLPPPGGINNGSSPPSPPAAMAMSKEDAHVLYTSRKQSQRMRRGGYNPGDVATGGRSAAPLASADFRDGGSASASAYHSAVAMGTDPLLFAGLSNADEMSDMSVGRHPQNNNTNKNSALRNNGGGSNSYLPPAVPAYGYDAEATRMHLTSSPITLPAPGSPVTGPAAPARELSVASLGAGGAYNNSRSGGTKGQSGEISSDDSFFDDDAKGPKSITSAVATSATPAAVHNASITSVESSVISGNRSFARNVDFFSSSSSSSSSDFFSSSSASSSSSLSSRKGGKSSNGDGRGGSSSNRAANSANAYPSPAAYSASSPQGAIGGYGYGGGAPQQRPEGGGAVSAGTQKPNRFASAAHDLDLYHSSSSSLESF